MERTACVLLVAAACALGCGREDPPGASADDSIAAPDNTAANARDRGSLTPIDQSEDKGDLRITAQIRQRLVESDALSTNAKNAKIITRDSVVTLRGPVQNTAEKAAIAALAQTTSGVTRVDNQLEVIGEEATP
jgi:osmotically-inducible protein OsmY